ncbi:MAG: SUMF1/EgtB/PvdO family nonheme iron enzyme [Bacteroidales bacterium]|nr:SUMF1/EgtB/PvdO family nonheme iron enzyme [Bacteroidales bacterium]
MGVRTRLVRVVCALVFIFHLSPFTLRAQDSVVRVELNEGVAIDMVWVEGGVFTMGSNEARGVSHGYESTKPEHEVTVGGFYIGRYEVTQAVWKAVMGENPSLFNGDSLPVEQVTWVEAQQFCALLSQLTGHRFRLPTEAEWEFAARGGVKSGDKKRQANPFAGCDRNRLGEYGWYCVNSDRSTHAVGRLLPNELGLYDMSGNVSEWCQDWMGPYESVAENNPQGPKTGESKVLRGGHYNGTSPMCTVYDRSWYVPSGKSEYFGLRLVMELQD